MNNIDRSPGRNRGINFSHILGELLDTYLILAPIPVPVLPVPAAPVFALDIV